MNRFLVLGLPRTGTSILCDLLAEQYQCPNYGEKWSVDSSDLDIRKYRADPRVIQRSFNLDMSKDFYMDFFYEEMEQRFNKIVDQKQKDWVLKTFVLEILAKKQFIDICLNNNIKIFFTQRKNVTEHFTSVIEAANRQKALSTMRPMFSGADYAFFNYNNKLFLKDNGNFNKLYLRDEEFNSQYQYFQFLIGMWRCVYELYKNDMTIISYEDEIKPMRLEKNGITEQTIKKYNKKDVHLIPTFMRNDICSGNDSFKRCLKLVSNLQYLVDIK